MKLTRLTDQLLMLLALGLCWWTGAWYVSDPLLPTPGAVWQALVREQHSGQLFQHITITLQRVMISFGLAMLFGTLLGLWMARCRGFNRLFDPLLVILLNIPALVVIILFYIWLGLIEAAAVAAVILNKLPNVMVTVREGGRMLDPELDEMATLYGFSFTKRALHVWWPQLFPFLMIATRSGLALIWKIVLVVELLGRSDGVGFQLHLAFQLFDVATILAYSFAFIAIVQLLEWLVLQPLDGYANRWQKGAQYA